MQFKNYSVKLSDLVKKFNDTDYRSAIEKVLDISGELEDRIEDYNSHVLEMNQIVLGENDNIRAFSAKQIADFVAEAMWSEYSAQFDSSDDYTIDEDTYFKTVKDILNK